MSSIKNTISKQQMTNSDRVNFWKAAAFLLVTVLVILASNDFYHGVVLLDQPPSFRSKRFVLFLVGITIFGCYWIIQFVLLLRKKQPFQRMFTVLGKFTQIPWILRTILGILFSLLPAVVILYSRFGLYELGYWLRLFILLVSSFTAVSFFYRPELSWRWMFNFSGGLVLAGAFYTAGDWLNQVTSYPFSLGWSEGNRMWDYSMLFGSYRYLLVSEEPVFTFISTGRQLVWALPYIFPNLTINMARLWDALTWIVPALVLGCLCIFRRGQKRGDLLIVFLFGGWVLSFLTQGPVYSPLILVAILVLIALRIRSLPLGLVIVAIAGYYAAISRFTWMYAPGIWAGMLAILETNDPGLLDRKWTRLTRPLAFALSGYVGAQFIPAFLEMLSGNAATVSLVVDAAGNINRQPLLWDRLWPNLTYPSGILLGALWAGGPLVLFLIASRLIRSWKTNWIQSLAVIVPACAFFVVGIIVSVKIGGGSNLHNLDLFWVTLVLVTGWAWKFHFYPKIITLQGNTIFAVVFFLAAIFPAAHNISSGRPLVLPPAELVAESLQKIQAGVNEANKSGEVLFIDQRQLLTFGMIKNVPLISDYEKKYLMDQAMSGDEAYFQKFHQDLARRRFKLIICEPLREIIVEEDTRNFALENNAWVKWVSNPVLQYYEPVDTMDEIGVQLLIPR